MPEARCRPGRAVGSASPRHQGTPYRATGKGRDKPSAGVQTSLADNSAHAEPPTCHPPWGATTPTQVRLGSTSQPDAARRKGPWRAMTTIKPVYLPKTLSEVSAPLSHRVACTKSISR